MGQSARPPLSLQETLPSSKRQLGPTTSPRGWAGGSGVPPGRSRRGLPPCPQHPTLSTKRLAPGGAQAPHTAPGRHPFGHAGSAGRTAGQNGEVGGSASQRGEPRLSSPESWNCQPRCPPDAHLLLPTKPRGSSPDAPPPPRPHRAPGTEHPRLRVQAPLSSPAQGPASRGGGTTDPNHSASEGKMRKKMRVLGTRGWGSPAHTSNVHIPGPKPAPFPRGKRSGAPGCSARSSTAPAPGSWSEIQPKTSSRRRSCCCWGAGGSPGPAPPASAARAKEIDPK